MESEQSRLGLLVQRPAPDSPHRWLGQGGGGGIEGRDLAGHRKEGKKGEVSRVIVDDYPAQSSRDTLSLTGNTHGALAWPVD